MSDISAINNALWTVGEQRLNVIRALAERRACPRILITEASQVLNVSERYVYDLIKCYRMSDGLLTSFIPKKPNGGKGKSRLPKFQETLIEEVIEDLYLSQQKLKAARIVEEVRKRCFAKNMKPPGERTVRRRLNRLSNTQLKVRGEKKLLQPIIGSSPEADYPLSVVQIDHTLVDLILVDPIDRLPIGRPYLTLAIDVYSRCIAGFVLSLDGPSAVSVGLCLTQIAQDKTSILSEHNIDAQWSIQGKPQKIYVDNGSDFHSAALTRGCAQHGIKIEYRPPGQPHYGGIMERVIGTLMGLVHALPGTTFSSIKERGQYNSDQYACLTLSELEHWLIITITKYYHLKLHQGIHEPPIKRYEKGVARMKQDDVTFPVVHNGKAFLIDFLPIAHRLLRREGFMLDHIIYYKDALRPFITERQNYGKFLIRRDPRDLSRIYVALPGDDGYLEVPCRILSRPAISLFEHRMALKRLHDHGKQAVDEAALFKAIDEIRDIVKTAASTTRSIRRRRTKLSEHKKIQPPAEKQSIISKPTIKIEDITPYETFEFWD